MINEKEKQSKIANAQYDRLEMQDYLNSGHCSINMARLIFKARSQTLDIKTQRKWKYSDIFCIGCESKEETAQEIMTCKVLNNENRTAIHPINYDIFFGKNISDKVKAARLIKNGLKRRQMILEIGITWNISGRTLGNIILPCARFILSSLLILCHNCS